MPRFLHSAPLARLLAVCLILALALPGCGPKTAGILQKGMEQEGKSLVIIRNASPGNYVYWKKSGDYSLEGDMNEYYQVGNGYLASLASPGTYYIYSLHDKAPAQTPVTEGEGSPTSLGEARVQETVEGKDKKAFYTTSLVPLDDGKGELLGALTVQAGEVLLTTGIVPYIAADRDAARVLYVPMPEGFTTQYSDYGDDEYSDAEFLMDIGLFAVVLLALPFYLLFGADEEREESVVFGPAWACPVQELSLDVVPPNLDDFMAKADKSLLPSGALKNVQIREVTLGSFFAATQNKAPLADTGGVRGQRYIFTADPSGKDGGIFGPIDKP